MYTNNSMKNLKWYINGSENVHIHGKKNWKNSSPEWQEDKQKGSSMYNILICQNSAVYLNWKASHFQLEYYFFWLITTVLWTFFDKLCHEIFV